MNFPEQLKKTKLWKEFEAWYNDKYGTFEFTTDVRFVFAPFAFQSGVLLKFLREKSNMLIGFDILRVRSSNGLNIQRLEYRYWIAHFDSHSEVSFLKEIQDNPDPDTALQGAILEAFNL